MSGVVLTGLDGANPLGFLAALGVLEVLADQGLPASLGWRDSGGWRPVVYGSQGGLDGIVAAIETDRCDCTHEPAFALTYDGKHDLKPPPVRFRGYLLELVQQGTSARRRGVDLAAAFASDVVADNNGNTKPTALHFTAGQQQFLKMVNELCTATTRDDLHEALLGPWRYGRPLPVMGWDATTTRDYALRASNPSTDKKQGVPGADWLAVRGLPAIPVAPRGDRLLTTGCIGGWKTGRFRWGLWTRPLERATVRSVMRLDVENMAPSERSARGIAVALSCGIKRNDQGGYGSFEPASVI